MRALWLGRLCFETFSTLNVVEMAVVVGTAVVGAAETAGAGAVGMVDSPGMRGTVGGEYMEGEKTL